MINAAKATQTDAEDRRIVHRRRILTMKNVLQFMSSLVLPLMLGVFTVVITFQQQNVAQQQRLEDRQAAQQQRLEDRQAAEELRTLEKTLSDERHLHEILNAYIKTMSSLMKETKGFVTSDPVVSTLARVETANAISQLDSRRIARIIRYLYEAGQLTASEGKDALDMSFVEFHQIDFRHAAKNRLDFYQLSLVGTHHFNVTFIGLEIKYTSFQSTQFSHADFSNAYLMHVNWSSSIVGDAYQSSLRGRMTKVVATKLTDINFSSALLEHVRLSYAELEHANFSYAQLFDVTFAKAKVSNADFSFAILKNVNFSFAELRNVKFALAQLQNVSFSFAKLHQVKFASDQSNSYYLNYLDFESSHLDHVSFTVLKFYQVSFKSSEQFNVNYTSAVLASTRFTGSRIFNTTFFRSQCLDCDFGSVYLVNVRYDRAHLKSSSFIEAVLVNVDFLEAILQNADLQYTTITDKQLQVVLSIQGAILPNGTVAQRSNLIENGLADCQVTLESHWELQAGNIAIESSPHDPENCRFTLKSLEFGATMWQHINLSHLSKFYFDLPSKAVFKALVSSDVSIQISSITLKNALFDLKTFRATDQVIQLELHRNISALEVLVYFPAQRTLDSQNESWCDSLELYIDIGPDTIVPFRIEPLIPPHSQYVENSITFIGTNRTVSSEETLKSPHGLFIDLDQKVLIADHRNHRIVAYDPSVSQVKVMVHGNGYSNQLNQLYSPVDVIVERGTTNFFVCEEGNRRVSRWSDGQAQFLVENIACAGLSMDNQDNLYVSDREKDEVRRYRLGEKRGSLVAGGHGRGQADHQLNQPSYIYVDRNYAVYVSDEKNHRVMKWMRGATKGIVVAGGHGEGNRAEQLASPLGLFVDGLENVYVADCTNHRIMRWNRDAKTGMIIVDGNNHDKEESSLRFPYGIALDQNGNLYVADYGNHRLRRFVLTRS